MIPGKLYQVKNAAFFSDGRPMPLMALIAMPEPGGWYSPYGEPTDLTDGDIVLVLPLENNYSLAEVICLHNERIVFIQRRHLQPIS